MSESLFSSRLAPGKRLFSHRVVGTEPDVVSRTILSEGSSSTSRVFVVVQEREGLVFDLLRFSVTNQPRGTRVLIVTTCTPHPQLFRAAVEVVEAWLHQNGEDAVLESFLQQARYEVMYMAAAWAAEEEHLRTPRE